MITYTGRFSLAIVDENNRGFVAVIPDIKCISPKEGDLLQGRNPIDTAKYLQDCGAPVISVVTERERFGGSPELLRDIVKNVSVPVLRKDFIINEDKLEETAQLGATAALLICAVIGEENLQLLYEKSIKLGLEPFVEVHNIKEMEFAKKLGAHLIGINNRDIVTLEMDNGNISRTVELASNAPDDALLISESGIFSKDDVMSAVSAGANAVLVGTALWQAHDMGEMYRSLRIGRIERKVSPCAR